MAGHGICPKLQVAGGIEILDSLFIVITSRIGLEERAIVKFLRKHSYKRISEYLHSHNSLKPAYPLPTPDFQSFRAPVVHPRLKQGKGIRREVLSRIIGDRHILRINRLIDRSRLSRHVDVLGEIEALPFHAANPYASNLDWIGRRDDPVGGLEKGGDDGPGWGCGK